MLCHARQQKAKRVNPDEGLWNWNLSRKALVKNFFPQEISNPTVPDQSLRIISALMSRSAKMKAKLRQVNHTRLFHMRNQPETVYAH